MGCLSRLVGECVLETSICNCVSLLPFGLSNVRVECVSK